MARYNVAPNVTIVMSLPCFLTARLALGDFIVTFRHAVGLELLADIVEKLTFEEDDGIGAAQREVHHALGVVGSRGKISLEPGYVRHEGGPVLTVLGARTCCRRRRAR